MSQDDDVAVVRALFDSFNEGNLDLAQTLVTEDFELVDHAANQTFHGPAGCREWLSLFRTALPDARAEIVNVFAGGDGWVASEHIGTGTHDGPLMTPAGAIPPTGRRLELRIAEIYQLREGRIAKLAAYYDGTTLMRQMGLLPPQGGIGDKAMAKAMGLGVRVVRKVRRR